MPKIILYILFPYSFTTHQFLSPSNHAIHDNPRIQLVVFPIIFQIDISDYKLINKMVGRAAVTWSPATQSIFQNVINKMSAAKCNEISNKYADHHDHCWWLDCAPWFIFSLCQELELSQAISRLLIAKSNSSLIQILQSRVITKYFKYLLSFCSFPIRI